MSTKYPNRLNEAAALRTYYLLFKQTVERYAKHTMIPLTEFLFEKQLFFVRMSHLCEHVIGLLFFLIN